MITKESSEGQVRQWNQDTEHVILGDKRVESEFESVGSREDGYHSLRPHTVRQEATTTHEPRYRTSA